jgi:hypothetical protein
MLAFLVLPMAALYTELRERGWSEPSAVDAATRALGVVLVRAERPPIGLLSRTALGRQALVQGTRRSRRGHPDCWARPGT